MKRNFYSSFLVFRQSHLSSQFFKSPRLSVRLHLNWFLIRITWLIRSLCDPSRDTCVPRSLPFAEHVYIRNDTERGSNDERGRIRNERRWLSDDVHRSNPVAWPTGQFKERSSWWCWLSSRGHALRTFTYILMTLCVSRQTCSRAVSHSVYCYATILMCINYHSWLIR